MAEVVVYWQPGCTSCLKTKEFLRLHGIDFESVNVRADPAALERLAALGIRTVPVVTRGPEFVLGQDLDAVAHFFGLRLQRPRLSAPVLVSRLLGLLDLAAQHAGQLPEAALDSRLPGRERTYLDLAYHVPQIVVGFLDAAQGGRLAYEHYERRPPGELRSAADATDLIRRVARSFAAWWSVSHTRAPETLDTYYGRQPMVGVLERTTWHVAQHLRQLDRVLDLVGVTSRRPIEPALLADLPLPNDVWDREVPLA